MTSNAGGEQRSDGLGFVPAGKAGQTETALRRCFTPEFLGRLDSVIHFAPLETETIHFIAEKYLQLLRHRAQMMGIELHYGSGLTEHLARQGIGKGGARQLRRIVQEEVEGPLAALLLRSGKKTADIRICLGAEGLEFSCSE
jgi:ATP-dependent Clp protease ATP-binding subunit ClpA